MATTSVHPGAVLAKLPEERVADGSEVADWATIPRMDSKIPWLPSELQSGQPAERCASCGAVALIPWTLRRDRNLPTPLRTWVCVRCQATVERPEPDL